MELLEPVERVGEQEVPHLVASEVEDERAPVGMRAAARVCVLVERRAVEARQRPVVPGEVRRDPVEQHADPVGVQRVDEGAQVVRFAERRLRGEVARHLVAPRRAERVLHHGHQLDVREARLDDVLHELVGKVAPAEPLPPRRGVHLVGRQRRGQRVRRSAAREPVGVRPLVAGAVEHGGGLRRRLRPEGQRVGLEPRLPVRAAHGEFVGLPLARPGSDADPDARGRLRLEWVGTLVPVVPVPDDRHRARVRRPDGEARARAVVVEQVGAESLPEPLVASFAEEVEVELAEVAHGAVSSSRSSPMTGMDAQPGRFRAS